MKVSKRQLRKIIKEEKKRLLTETMIEWEGYPDVGDAIFDFAETLTTLVAETGAFDRFPLSHIDRVVNDALFSAASEIADELGLSYED